MDVSDAIELIAPGLAMAAGLALVLFPRRHRQRRERAHAARLAELDKGGAEGFFEERRTLEAYPPARSDWAWRLLGAVVFAAGALQIYRFWVA